MPDFRCEPLPDAALVREPPPDAAFLELPPEDGLAREPDAALLPEPPLDAALLPEPPPEDGLARELLLPAGALAPELAPEEDVALVDLDFDLADALREAAVF